MTHQPIAIKPGLDGGFSIVIDQGNSGNEYKFGHYSGFKLVAAPEPASVAVLAVGGMLLLPRRSRRSAA